MKTTAHFKPVTFALALSAFVSTVAFAQPTSVESIQSAPGSNSLPIAILGARFESLVNVA